MNVPAADPRTVSLGGRQFTIRAMARGDGEAVQAFADTVAPHDLLFLQRDIRKPRVVAAWIEQIERGLIASQLALLGGTVVACTALVRDELSWSPHVGEVRLLVGAEARGSGLGRWLAQDAVANAEAAGVEKLFVRLTPDQAGALALFEDMGFRPEALLRDHVREESGTTHDIAIMALNLGQLRARHGYYGVGGEA